MITFEDYISLRKKYANLKMYEYSNVFGALLYGMQFYYDHGRMMNDKEMHEYMQKYMDEVIM